LAVALRSFAPSASDQSTGLKCPACESVHASARICACQGSSKVGSSSRRANGANCRALVALKVALPEIKEYAVLAPLCLGPQRGGIKSDRIQWLSSFLTERVRIGKNVCTLQGLDPAPSTAHVGRKASVAANTVILRSHPIACRESGRLF